MPDVRLTAPSTSTAGDARVTLGPAAVRELGVQLGDPVAVDVRWSRKLGEGEGGQVGSGGGDEDGTAAAAPDDGDEWTWTFLVRASCYPAIYYRVSFFIGVFERSPHALSLVRTATNPFGVSSFFFCRRRR